MAKMPFSKLGVKLDKEVKTVEVNGQTIEVKQYLPIDEKLQLVTNVMELSADDNSFINIMKVESHLKLQILKAYTNITFTEKQEEDLTKLFDICYSSGLIDDVMAMMPEDEYCELIKGCKNIIKSYYDYKNSVYGILDSISRDYSQLSFDATEIQKKLADPDNLDLLRNIMTKLG